MVLGPSQVAANLIKFQYSPSLKSQEMVSAVYVTPSGSGTASLQDAQGKKVGMPHYESLTGGLARAQLNEMGISGKKYFAELHYQPVSEATLYGLNIGRYDVAVADADMAQAWVRKNGGKIIAKTSPSPSMAFSIKESVSTSQADKINNALLAHDGIRFARAEKSEFKKIGSMLNTTPTALPGARVVQAAQAKILIGQGIPVYDVRMKEEFHDAHIPGAIHVPYNESSAKEPEFDASSDSFNLSKLPQNKNSALLMYCDGTTCWKSYKSATMAIKNGWKNIIWFRGGFPEWKAAGYTVESGKPNKTASR
jgi:rhodanese-related sulfurtransferase